VELKVRLVDRTNDNLQANMVALAKKKDGTESPPNRAEKNAQEAVVDNSNDEEAP